jgi:hypothetical protein
MSYTVIQADDQVVSNDTVVSTAWTNNQYTLTTFWTSSAQETGSTGQFYLNSYQTSSALSYAESQFAVAWGDLNGSASANFMSAAPNYTPTKDIYGQYRALILGDENSKFMFDYTSGSNQIGVISVERSRYKQSFNPGSLTLNLKNGSTTLTLTDNSIVDAGNVSGSNQATNNARH